MNRTNTAEYRRIQPLVIADIRAIVAAVNSGSGSGGSTTVALTAHALSDTTIHTGTLATSQAPWAVPYSTYNVHIANPDAHHATATVVAPLAITGQQVSLSLGHGVESSSSALRVKLPTNSGLVRDTSGIYLSPSALTVATTNAVSGSGHTHAITSSSNPGAAAAILATDSSGILTLARLDISGATGQIVIMDRSATRDWLSYVQSGSYRLYADSADRFIFSSSGALQTASHMTLQPTDDLILNPGSNLTKLASSKVFQSDNYASQLTGMRITHDGQGDFRYIFVDELHAKAFIADLEQALAGGQIICKSVSMLGAAFTVPAAGSTATLTVRDLPSAENMAVFESGDEVRLRVFSRAGGGLTIADCWGVVTGYTDLADKLQSWTFTRHTAVGGKAGTVSAGTVIAVDSIVLDYGVSGNGYHEVNAIDGLYGANSPYSQIVTWTDHPVTGSVVRTRMGNLYGLFSVAGEYGLYAGNGTGNNDGYLRISSNSVRLNNIPLTLYSSGTQKVNISATGTDVWIGTSSSDKRLAWDGTTLSVQGTIVVTGGSGIGSFTDANLDNIDDGSTYGRINGTIISGGYIRVGSGTKDSTLDGFHISATEIVGQLDGADQVVMGTDGAIRAGGGAVWLDGDGLNLTPYTSFLSDSVNILWPNAYHDPIRIYAKVGSGSNTCGVAIEIPDSGINLEQALVIRRRDYPSAGTSAIYQVWHAGNDGTGSTLDADTLDSYEASAFGRLAAGSTWTDTQYFSKTSGRAWRAYIDTSGTAYGPDIYTSGALNTSTGGDYMSFVHLANDVMAVIVGDGSNYRTLALQPHGGSVAIGGGTSTASYTLDVSGELRVTGSVRAETALGLKAVAEPSTSATYAVLWVDSGDGDLYVKFTNGTKVKLASN